MHPAVLLQKGRSLAFFSQGLLERAQRAQMAIGAEMSALPVRAIPCDTHK